MPNAAALFAGVTVLYGLTLFDAPRQLFRDSDTGWHVRTGETILQTAQLPNTDPYSFSRSGAPWVAWEWGADVLMALTHRWGGLRGVAALYLAAIGLVTWLWFQLHWAAGTTFLVACAALPPMITTASLHWLARPHVLGWICLLMALLWAERGVRRPWLGFLLGCLWGNLHASFFLGPLVLALYAARRRPRTTYALAAVATAAGTLLNPYGAALHAHVAQYLFNPELLQRIAEFQTFNFQLAGSGQVILTLALAASGAVLAGVERRWEHAAILGLFSLIGLRHARGLPLLAVSALPLAMAAWSRALPWPRLLNYSANLRAIDQRLPSWPAAPLIAILLMLLPVSTGFSPREFPVAAAAHIPPGARVFAPDKFGGYLIYRFGGQLPVFFDGRSDFYGQQFLTEYIRMVEVRPGWEALFDRWRFTHALVAPDAPLRAALEGRGWRMLFANEAAMLLAAPPR